MIMGTGIRKRWSVKAPAFSRSGAPGVDTCRIVPCCALPQSCPIVAYRGIIIPLLCSYRGGSQGLSPTYEQAHVGSDLLTLASIKSDKKPLCRNVRRFFFTGRKRKSAHCFKTRKLSDIDKKQQWNFRSRIC